jgi:antitoxin component of RelBE/YafQ-DinJ toxin-antitoxin module
MPCPVTEPAVAAQLLQLQISLETDLQDRAIRNHARVGLTIPDVVRTLLIRIAREGSLPADLIDE